MEALNIFYQNQVVATSWNNQLFVFNSLLEINYIFCVY